MNHGRKIHPEYSLLPMENVVQLLVPGAEQQPCNILLNKLLRPAVQTDLKATSKTGLKTHFQINFGFQGEARFKSWQDGHVDFFFSVFVCFDFIQTQKTMWCFRVLFSLLLSRQIILLSVPQSYKVFLKIPHYNHLHTFILHSTLPQVAFHFDSFLLTSQQITWSNTFSPMFTASSKQNSSLGGQSVCSGGNTDKVSTLRGLWHNKVLCVSTHFLKSAADHRLEEEHQQLQSCLDYCINVRMKSKTAPIKK